MNRNIAKEKQAKYQSIREAIELIAKDQLNPRTLKVEDRRLCVEFLRYEMRYPVRNIAKVLAMTEAMVNADLRVINIGMAKIMEHGEMGAEIVGAIMQQLKTNYDMALEKRDVSGANKTTEMLKEIGQDLGLITKAGDVVHHKGLDILALAMGATEKDKK